MSGFSNFLLRLPSYYSIFFGFSYSYVDYENRQLKSCFYLKVYVYLINLIYSGQILYYTVDNFGYEMLYNENSIISSAYIIINLLDLIIFGNLIITRFKQDKKFEEYQKILRPLHIEYFDKLTYIPINETSKVLIIINILSLGTQTFCVILILVPHLFKDQLFNIMDICLQHYLLAMQQYILLQHAFILSYFNYCYSKLNTKLQYFLIQETYAQIYIKISLILQKINNHNEVLIFLVLISLFLKISLYLYGTILFAYEIHSNFSKYSYDFILELNIFIFLCINIFLYFLICERLCETTKESRRILMDYNVQSCNQEVGLLIVLK